MNEGGVSTTGVMFRVRSNFWFVLLRVWGYGTIGWDILRMAFCNIYLFFIRALSRSGRNRGGKDKPKSRLSTEVSHNDVILVFPEEAETIMDHLLDGERNLDVISIVGMAGVGKTTLALTLSKTRSMVDHFDILAHCTVSQSYQRRALLLSLLPPILDQTSDKDDQDDGEIWKNDAHSIIFLIYGTLSNFFAKIAHFYLKSPKYPHSSSSSSSSTPNLQDDDPKKSYTSLSKKKSSKKKSSKQQSSKQKSSKQQLSNMDDEELADHLCRKLKRRRYLIVLDDIWDTEVWNDLKHYLPDDREGSRILITTRNKNVADDISSKVNELHKLSKDSSWDLFQKKMVKEVDSSDDLWEIAKGIVENCEGLPLSIVIIAGILSNIERTEERWKQIEGNVTSRVFSDPQGKCKAILELSYNHLENHLKQCFLYLASFPEDQKISVKQLINRWIGEGFVGDTNSESAEEVAKKYIKNLIVKSLVIPVKERLGGGVKTFRLHDLLRDFCLSKAEDENFFTILDKRYDYPQPLQDPTRLITNGPWIDDLSFSYHNIQSMISYFDMEAFEIQNRKESCDMVLLKVLDVGRVSSNRFPNISSLVQLRYLAFGLRNLKTSELPEVWSSSISKLEKLQILILKFGQAVKVPDFIWDMKKLRHVHISKEASFEVDSNRLKNSSVLLENLRSLLMARVSKWDSRWLRRLSGLQSLSCVFVEYVSDDGSDEDDVIKMDYPEDHESRMLRFNDHLTSLKVRNDADRNLRFKGTCQLPRNLVELTLSKFYLEVDDLLIIGRAVVHLEVFKIFDCSVPNGCEWKVDDEFPKLKVLKFRRFKIRRLITTENSFPNLEQLLVVKCNRIKEVPVDFGYLEYLRLISIRKCDPSLDDSAREIEKQQHEQQNSEMRALIYPRKW